jgi:hypothetical protein
MDDSLPPIPADLWPHAHPARSSRPEGKMLTLEVPGLTETLLLSVLARAIHLEMKAAGEWAARVGTSTDNDFPSARSFFRFRTENATRLLSLYTALFAAGLYLTSSDASPEALRASASHSYQLGFREAWRSLETSSESLRPIAQSNERTSSFTARR